MPAVPTYWPYGCETLQQQLENLNISAFHVQSPNRVTTVHSNYLTAGFLIKLKLEWSNYRLWPVTLYIGAQCRDPVRCSSRDPARLADLPQACHPHPARRGSRQWVSASCDSHNLGLARDFLFFISRFCFLSCFPAGKSCFSPLFKFEEMQEIVKNFTLIHIDAPGQEEGAAAYPAGYHTSLDFFQINSSEVRTIFCAELKPNLTKILPIASISLHSGF